MNKNKTISLIMSKNLIILGLLFSILFNPVYAGSRCETFCSYLVLTCQVFHTIRVFRSCPYLYEKGTFKNPEEYLDFLENKIIYWQFLLENPTEDQLNSFRCELLEYYERILKKRSFFSMLLTDSVPHQPWALFKEEIGQHLSQLSSYKCRHSFNKDTNVAFKTSVPLYSQELIDRIDRLEVTLNKIKKCTQVWPTYQNECSQARQEEHISKIFDYLCMFYCSYFLTRLLDNALLRTSFDVLIMRERYRYKNI